jgi:hypothetical protein
MPTDTAPATAPSEQVHEFQIAGAAGRRAISLGVLALIAAAVLVALSIRLAVHGSGPTALRAVLWVAAIALAAAGAQVLRGLTQVTPGEAVVVQLLGSYRGTIREPGLTWVHPWSVRRRVSVKIRSCQTPVMRVNDSEGNPVEIALVAVWEVADTARAVFAVDDVAGFVAIQAEIAARQTASSYPYDDHGTGKPCLRASTAEITGWLCADMAERVAAAGVHVSRPGSRSSATLRKSRTPCSGGSRPTRSWPPARRSWTARSAWSSRPCPGSQSTASSSSTRSARRPWSATCLSSCAATRPRSRWSTPARSISKETWPPHGNRA